MLCLLLIVDSLPQLSVNCGWLAYRVHLNECTNSNDLWKSVYIMVCISSTHSLESVRRQYYQEFYISIKSVFKLYNLSKKCRYHISTTTDSSVKIKCLKTALISISQYFIFHPLNIKTCNSVCPAVCWLYWMMIWPHTFDVVQYFVLRTTLLNPFCQMFALMKPKINM